MLLKTWLATIPDHRRPQGRKYALEPLLLFSILAVLSGATSYRKITCFMTVRLALLNRVCGVNWRRAPAHTALRYAFQGLDLKAVETAFRGHAAQLAALYPAPQVEPDAEGEAAADAAVPLTIAVDGKTLRGSADHFADQKAQQILSALATDSTLILGQILLDVTTDKAHEIPAAQQLISELNLSGRLFTLDALHAQKKP